MGQASLYNNRSTDECSWVCIPCVCTSRYESILHWRVAGTCLTRSMDHFLAMTSHEADRNLDCFKPICLSMLLCQSADNEIIVSEMTINSSVEHYRANNSYYSPPVAPRYYSKSHFEKERWQQVQILSNGGCNKHQLMVQYYNSRVAFCNDNVLEPAVSRSPQNITIWLRRIVLVKTKRFC